jgi:hypothetical protein
MSEIPREELSATLAARHELGPEYETALVDSLAERVEQVVQARVAAQQVAAPPPPAQAPPMALTPAHRVAIAAISLGVAIPITAIAGDAAGVAGIAITWAGIAVINVAAAISPAVGRR